MAAMRRTALLAALALPLASAAAVALPEPSDQARDYYLLTNALWIVGLAWGFAIPAFVLATGWSARMRTWALARTRRRWLALFLYLALYAAIEFALTLPLAFYGGYVVEHRFGLSEQTVAKWATDALVSLLLGLGVGFVVVSGVYALLGRSPARWWLYSGLAAIPFIVLLFLVTPIWIDPLFNKVGPMKDRALEARIVALASRAGIDGARVFEVEKSVDTRKLNAYVNGFGETKRIVLWDTIVRRLAPRELLFVMGHEMGHFVLHHAWVLIASFSAIAMAALYAAHRLAHGLIRRFGRRFGFDRLDDFASYPLIALVAGLVVVAVTPAFLAVSRTLERDADRFGLEITRDNEGCASAFVKMTTDNLAIPRPNPILHALRGSHPTVAERVEFCNTYRPWERGEPLRYGARFR